MTKFILHGGFDKERPVQEDDKFFREILKDTPENVKILLVYFAVREEKVQLRIDHSKEQFNKNKGVHNLHLKVTSKETFLEDCAWADVIYLHGGYTTKIMEALKKYQNLGQVFSGKIIAGDSAGVNALGQVFFSHNSNMAGEGLKILPFKVVVHYKDGTPNSLGQIKPELETVFLREYETKVFSF